MTIKELYEKIGGNYDHAVQVMKMEKLIDRYVRKLKTSNVDKSLEQAAQTMDPVQLFESAHAMKGICANLGLDALAAAADEITEEFRPGNERRLSDEEVKEKLDNALSLFHSTLEGITEYEQSNS